MIELHTPGRTRRRVLVAVASALGIGVLLALLTCRTVVEPLELWRSAPALEGYDLTDLDRALAEWVDDDGKVDYASLKSDPSTLERFYAQFARVSPATHPGLFPDRDAHLAYWINAYNIAVLLSVVRNYPIETVKDVKPPLVVFFLPDLAGFFSLRLHVFGGRKLSLRALRDDVLRGGFDDPRIHFALHSASAGSPKLPRRAFRGATLKKALEAETRRFFSEERNLRIDHQQETIFLSQIIEWYEEDFTGYLAAQGSESTTLLEYAARCANPETADELRGAASDYALRFVPFDWSLNDRRRTR